MEQVATQTKWQVDPTHSEVSFRVKHLMITNVRGVFEKFNIDADCPGDDFTQAKVKFTAEASSVTTFNEQRDAHLRGPDFFDADNSPQIQFTSTGMKKTGEDHFEMSGDLTIRGVTKPITCKVELGGIAKDPWGNIKAGFTVNASINRKDYGLIWNAPTEAGGFLVADDVKVHCEIQMVKQAS